MPAGEWVRHQDEVSKAAWTAADSSSWGHTPACRVNGITGRGVYPVGYTGFPETWPLWSILRTLIFLGNITLVPWGSETVVLPVLFPRLLGETAVNWERA